MRPETPTFAELISTSVTVPLSAKRSTKLELRPEAVKWGSHQVCFDDAVDLRYAARFESTALWQQRLVRRVILQGRNDTLDIALGLEAVGAVASSIQVQAYLSLVEHLHSTLEPRLRDAAMRRLRQGHTLDCGTVALSAEGLLVSVPRRRSRTVIAWERLPSAQFEGDSVQIFADTPEGSAMVAEVSMLAPHSVLLPELLVDAISALT
jgi:hypothetical protein